MASGPRPTAVAPARYAEVARVLVYVLLLNLGVALAKIAFGYSSGAISILSDGFHSLTDAASNGSGWSASMRRSSRRMRTIRTDIGSTRPWQPGP